MKNWEVEYLDDVCELITCGVAARPNYVDEGVPFLSAKNVKDGQIIWSGYNCISEETHKELTKNSKPLKGDLLYTRVGSYGEAAVIEDDYEFSVFVSLTLIKVDKSKLNNYYLKHYLNSEAVKNLAKASISGSGVGNLNVGTVRKFKIPLPPLPEQQRIVSILDEAFACIERSRNAAIKNLKNAKELFESYLQGVFENGNWEKKTLKELTTKIGSGATPRGGQENYKVEGISLVRSMNVHDWEFRERNLAFIDEKQAKELDGVSLLENDVLLNITGASVARCCIFPKEYLPARVNQHVSIIRPKKELLDATFLNLLLTSKPYKDQLLFTGEQGATRQAITKAQIESFRISIPPLKEQQTIVRQLDALRAETQKLEAVYQKKIEDLEELKKSILQKAFAGKLRGGEPVEPNTEKALAL
ncbi:MAG: restriction endonuclease subunit S [Bacteroidota bacterium]